MLSLNELCIQNRTLDPGGLKPARVTCQFAGSPRDKRAFYNGAKCSYDQDGWIPDKFNPIGENRADMSRHLRWYPGGDCRSSPSLTFPAEVIAFKHGSQLTSLQIQFESWPAPIRMLTRQRTFALSGIDQESNSKLTYSITLRLNHGHFRLPDSIDVVIQQALASGSILLPGQQAAKGETA